VKVGTGQSALTFINAVVPQGSVLGPLLYLLYTADLPTSPGTLSATFADDTSILTTDSDPVVASQLLQTDLITIQNWLKTWRMNE
jgi:histone H2A